ncbi:FAD:protein FMN transferase [Conexibacter sp. SYSU D00693]|uniref:FAD:protein FMN transferase n=1 Tax=Conexibacter sp. SYSU D00693 TaxID=2812560 RepID=UPI00196AEFFB|nr:FAD:protein FMN transferase [Conexibacter sp. SYSU D00693]
MTATLAPPAETTEDRTFRALGTTVRVVVQAPDARTRADAVVDLVHDFDARLSRFRPDSELCALNADPRWTVPASALLRDAVRCGLWAARRSGGLVDPTLLDALEDAGYRTSLADHTAPQVVSTDQGPARPDPAARWREVRVQEARGAIVRPPGLRLDLGGTGKGHVADLAARLLDGAARWAIDCGGDVRVGGTAGPQPVAIAGPDGSTAATFHVEHGAIATSAIHARAWVTQDGTVAHHLLDPATGRPAHTGLVQVTALAPTVLEAETLAKTALLSGSTDPLTAYGGFAIDQHATTSEVPA